MGPVLRYQPHFLIGIELDAEWSRARATDGVCDPLATVKARIEKVCTEYRHSVEILGHKYAASYPAYQPTGLDPALFDPLFCLPSGHADGLAFVLVDDFDAVHHIASHSRVIEDMVMAFCPAVDSFGYGEHPVIKDVEAHWAEGSLPVRMLSRYKLDSLCNLEFGLLFKRAVFRAMARRVEQCVAYFRALAPDDKHAAGHGRGFLVSFLSMQGQEEIGVFCSGHNAEMVVALSSAVRSLTLPDLFPVDDNDPQTDLLRKLLFEMPPAPTGQNHYSPGQLHHSLFAPAQRADPDASWSRTPVFRWSRSVLGFRLDGTAECLAPSAPIEGSVSLDLEFQLIPGFPVKVEPFTNASQDARPAPAEQRFAEVGTFDFRQTIGSSRSVISMDTSVRHILRCIRTVVEGNHRGERTGVLGIETAFLVPIPNCHPFVIKGAVAESELDQKLYRIRHLIDAPNREDSFMSFDKLLKLPQRYNLPRALRRSIESLFRNFLTALANPNLFDLIIDLYDAFNTLHRVLTVVLPNKLSAPAEKQTSIHPKQAKDLAQFTTVLRNALERRLSLAYPDSTVRNVSLQFPGSLAQILLASDAPLKVGLGILKYHLPTNRDATEAKETGLSALHHVGVVTDITLEPGIRTVNLSIDTDKGIENPSARLSYLCLDVDHLFHVGSYFDYIHEAFHLVFDELVTGQAKMDRSGMSARYVQDESRIRERVEETFVQLASFMFCSPDRPRELLRYMVGKYALDIRSSHGSHAMRISHFAERYVCLSIASWLVSTRLQENRPLQPDEDWFGEVIGFAQDNMEASFELLPETAVADPDQLSVLRESCSEHIKVYLNEGQFGYYLPELWRLTLDLYQQLVEDHPGFDLKSRAQYSESLTQIQAGWALTRYDQNSLQHLNSVVATALILGQYITRHGVTIRHEPGTRYQLDRDSATKVIKFQPLRYADYLIDRGGAQRFCFKPEARASRLHNQIAIIESFWDFSCHFRARRVMDLLVRFDVVRTPSTKVVA